MYAYKFRLFFDEVEDFVRDYEILAEQTFFDFHSAIIKSIKGLYGNELASFYVSDSRWNKLREITLMDMGDDDGQTPKITMNNAVLSDLIEEPHQRLIYEYDFFNIKTFFIELLKSSEANTDRHTYPRCTASSGELPKQATLSSKNEFDFSNLMDEELEGIDDESNEDYYDEEDLETLSNDIEF